MKIIEKKLDDLIPYANNPRQNDNAVQGVAESIRQFGFKNPIIIDKDNVIVAGHTRYKASRLLGLETVPTITADDLSEAQVRAFRIADNRTAEAATWDEILLAEELNAVKDDFDMEALGFGDLLKEIDPDAYEDEYEEELPEEPKSQQGDVYQLGRHRLMCGDSTKPEDYAALLEGAQVDLIVTDPPYNVDYEGQGGAKIQNDSMSNASFVAFLTDAFTAMKSALRPGGAFYVWHADSTRYEFLQGLDHAGLQTRQILVWVKSSITLGRQDYQWKHDPAIYGWKDGAAHHFTLDRSLPTVIEDQPNVAKMTKDEMKDYIKDLRARIDEGSTVLRVDKPSNSDLHPTMKPVRLIAQLIRNSSKRGDRILDIFGGSGTTLIAAEQLDRSCYMMELDPRYADVIIARWEKMTGQTAVKLN